MNVLVACKILPDNQDIKVSPNGELDFSRASQVVSEYDLNALEAAAALKGDGKVVAVTVGDEDADDSKVRKNILARGVDELFQTICNGPLDARATANELAKLVEKAGSYDAVLVGDGSADYYAKQTGVQLAAMLDVPYVSNVIEASTEGATITARRLNGNEVETVSVDAPCVMAIAPDFAEPRICGMRDILAAGKKPSTVEKSDGATSTSIQEVSLKAPAPVDREIQIFEDVDSFAAAVKAIL